MIAMLEQNSFVSVAYDWMMEMEKYSGQVQKLTKLTLNPKSIFHQGGRGGKKWRSGICLEKLSSVQVFKLSILQVLRTEGSEFNSRKG